jgi:hypothetical protein
MLLQYAHTRSQTRLASWRAQAPGSLRAELDAATGVCGDAADDRFDVDVPAELVQELMAEFRSEESSDSESTVDA